MQNQFEQMRFEQIEFGTDGIRGKTDQFPFIPHALEKLGNAIAQWSIKKYQTKNPHLLIGYDTRLSCSSIKKSLEQGLSSYPLHITDGGVLPTPAILQLIKQNNNHFHFGIVISASHNPYTDNGIKLFDARTGKLNHKDEKEIINNFYHPSTQKEQQGTIISWSDAPKIYEKNITKLFSKNLLANKKIVLDCAHGATSQVAPEIFSQLGANVVTISNSPTGTNINKNCGALHPETMVPVIKQQNADIGFAFDGDGDRVIAVTKQGIIKDGDDLLAALLQHPDVTNEDGIVGTIMTNYGFEKYLKTRNKKLIRTKVGDKYVAAGLEKNNLLLGGETSGHIIITNYLPTGDGIFVALKVLEALITSNTSLELDMVTKTPQILINTPILKKEPLTKEPYAALINSYEKKLINGRIVVRYSGTENVLRVMVEDQTNDNAQNIAQGLSSQLQEKINNSLA